MAQSITILSKPKDSNIAIYSFSDEDYTFTASKLGNDHSFVGLTHDPNSVEIATNFTATSFHTPNEDCIVCATYRGYPVCFNVGLPEKKFIYYASEEDKEIPYIHTTVSGVEISTGVLTEAGNGFYYLPIEVDDSMTVVFIDQIPFLVRTSVEEVTEIKTSGTIKIQNNVWQLVAIPRKGAKVKEYFCDRLAAKYNCNPEDMIEVCSAFFGDENKFRSYIPSVTNASTSNNFPLIYSDESSDEVTGFWVKTKDLSDIVEDTSNITLSWEAT